MAWLPTPTGRTAAEYPLDIHGGNNIPSYLLNRRNPYSEAIKAIAPALKEYLAQKRADEIANQYLNMENPPRAEAVDQYGATYDPQLALSQGLNSPTEPRATPPNTGGADAYKAHALYRSYLDKQSADQSQSTNDYWKNKVLEAQANKYEADANAPDPRLTSAEAPVVDPATGFIWNGREWVRPKSSGRSVELPPGVPQETYRNSKNARPFNPAQAFRDWQAEHQNSQPPLQEPDLPHSQANQEAPPTPERSQLEADNIRKAYRAGQISRDEAKQRLNALGFD